MTDIGVLCLMMMTAMAVTVSRPLTDGPPKYLDAKGCSFRYDFSVRHWFRLVDAGKAPPPTRFGRLVRWNLSALEKWESDGCPPCRRRAGL